MYKGRKGEGGRRCGEGGMYKGSKEGGMNRGEVIKAHCYLSVFH